MKNIYAFLLPQFLFWLSQHHRMEKSIILLQV